MPQSLKRSRFRGRVQKHPLSALYLFDQSRWLDTETFVNSQRRLRKNRQANAMQAKLSGTFMTHELKALFACGAVWVVIVGTLRGADSNTQIPPQSPLVSPQTQVGTGVEVLANLKLKGNRLLKGAVSFWDVRVLRVKDGSDAKNPQSFVEVPWNDLPAVEAWRLLKQLGKAQPTRWIDVVTVLAAHPKGADTVKQAADLARGDGIAQASLDIAKTRGEGMLAETRTEEQREARKLIARRNPEASPFVLELWSTVSPEVFEAQSATQLDTAREFLARAGGSGNAFQGQSITLLTEVVQSDEKVFAGRIDLDARVAMELLAESGDEPALGARIIVIQLIDASRYRLLLEGAFGLDPAAFEHGVTAYTSKGPIVVMPPFVDAAEREATIARLLARGVLHAFISNARLPAWANEALPMIAGDLAVPNAKRDISARKLALAAIRSGATLSALINTEYASAQWTQQRALSESSSYLFGRRAFEENRSAFIGWIAAVKRGEEPSAAWMKAFRVTPATSMASSTRWFLTND